MTVEFPFFSIQSSSAPFVSYSKCLVIKVCYWTWFKTLREECTVCICAEQQSDESFLIILVFSFINSALTTLHPLVSVIRRINVWLCQILKKNARCSVFNKYVDSDLEFLFRGKSVSEMSCRLEVSMYFLKRAENISLWMIFFFFLLNNHFVFTHAVN